MRSAIEMAKEAGFMLRAESVKGQSDWWECFDEAIEKLVALARADALANIDPTGFMSYQEADAAGRFAEREACWRLCDALWIEGKDAHDCREAIRARGKA
jgi:hypothetical protein